MLAALSLALLVGAASAQTEDCSGRAKCDVCTRGNEADSQDFVCSWCESTKECRFAYSKSNADFGNYIEAINSCPDGQYVDRDGGCECATSGADNCETCTSNPTCTWVEHGTTTVVFEGTVLGTTVSRESTSEFENLCWGGNGFGGPDFDDREVRGDNFMLSISSKADTWYWGQCGIEGPGFAALILVIVVVVVVALAGGVGFFLRKRKASK